MNRNIIEAKCVECIRTIEVTQDLSSAVEHRYLVVCKDCRCPLQITFGNLCADHYEDLHKGYCNMCAREELMDNQL